jgi:hypothetical protein
MESAVGGFGGHNGGYVKPRERGARLDEWKGPVHGVVGADEEAGSSFGEGVAGLEHELAYRWPVVAVDMLLVVGEGNGVHRDFGVGVQAELLRAFVRNGAVAEGGSFGGAGYDADVLHEDRVQRSAIGVGQEEGAVFGDREVGIEGDFPGKVVGIGEVAGVASPEGFLGGLEDFCAGGIGLGEDGVDFGAGAGVVGDRDAGKAVPFGGKVGIFRQLGARVKGQGHAAGLKKDDCFGARGRGAPAKALEETATAIKVGDSKREDADALVHTGNSA